MRSHSLSDYAAEVEKNTDESDWLGRLVGISFHSIKVPHAEMCQILEDQNIPGEPPLEPADINIFKKIVKEVVARHNPKGTPIGAYNRWRLVSFDDEYALTRRLIKDEIDGHGKKIASTEVVDVTFDRETSFVAPQQCNPAYPVDHNGNATIPPPEGEIMQEMIDEYESWRGCLDNAAVRGFVRKSIINLGATLTPFGAYFVATEKSAAVDALENLGDLLNDANGTPGAWGDVTIHSMPLVDTSRQRDMIKKAFEQGAESEIEDFLTEIGTALKAHKETGRKVRSDKFERIESKYAELMAKTQDYQDMLEDHLADTQAKLKIFFKSINDLAAISGTGE